MTIVELHMNIDCDGCEDNLRKSLLKLEGVHYVNVDRLHGKVTVTGSTSQKKVLRAARRTGKLAVLWPSAYNDPAYLHAYAQPQPAYLHAYAQPQPAYYHHHNQASAYSYHAEPAAAHAQRLHQHHHDDDYAGRTRKHGGGVSAVGRTQQQHRNKVTSSYNYHVHGYLDSDLYGGYHGHQQHDVVPADVRSYFSDENPSACSIMCSSLFVCL